MTAAWPHVVAALIKTSAAYNYGFVVAVPVPNAQLSVLHSPFAVLSSQFPIYQLQSLILDPATNAIRSASFFSAS